jgi:hypothetical protein
MKAAQVGAGDAAEVYIRKLEAAKVATHSLGLESAGARRELGVLAGNYCVVTSARCVAPG